MAVYESRHKLVYMGRPVRYDKAIDRMVTSISAKSHTLTVLEIVVSTKKVSATKNTF